ncbi:uncharacterized protein LOC134968647 [Pseudophryne corroboree]|uniref:uncharacterized protein LOC134968647 n=1 Tax=Pseudophryne corroboree TaxID=495146 RepID=UPI0030816CD5
MASHLEEAKSSDEEEFIADKRREKMPVLKKRRIFDSLEEPGSIKRARRRTSTKSNKVGSKRSLRMEDGCIVISSDDGSQENTNQKYDKSRKRQGKVEESCINSRKIADRKRRRTSGEDIQRGHGVHRLEDGYIVISSDDGQDNINRKSAKSRRIQGKVEKSCINSRKDADGKSRRTSGDDIQKEHGDCGSQERAGGSGDQEAGPGHGDTASIYIKRLSFLYELGQGNFGKVVLAEDSVTGLQLAVKIIRKKDLPLEDREEVLVERRVLEVASGSPFLIHAHLAFQTPVWCSSY